MVQLLQLAASARLEPTSYPLVPHRIHVMARPADGLTVCLNSGCAGLDNLLRPLGAVSVGYQDTCESCGSSTLIPGTVPELRRMATLWSGQGFSHYRRAA